MSDALHTIVKQVRDSYLDSLSQTIHSLFANLESKIRDAGFGGGSVERDDFVTKKEFQELKDRVDTQIIPVLNRIVPDLNAITPILVDWRSNMAELKGMFEGLQKTVHSQNVVVKSEPVVPVSSPAPKKVTVEKVVEEEEEMEAECESAPGEAEQSETEPSFTAMEVDGKTYWLDEDHLVYKETDEGYEQIGSYDPETGELSIEEEEEGVEEEEGDAEELEEFQYKGKTYYRDSENIVYNEDVEEVGLWTGSKIVAKKS